MIRAILFTTLLLSGWTSFSQTKEEAEILDLSRKKFRWMVEARLDSLNGLLDERLSYIHSSGWTQTKKEFLDDFTNGKLTYHSIVPREMSARVYKRSAVVTGKVEINNTMNGKTSVSNIMFTEVYVVQKGGWKLVSRHASKLP